MFRLLFLLGLFFVSEASAELKVSDDGDAMLRHCKSALINTGQYTSEEGFCVGTVETLATFGQILPETYRFCPPRGVSHEVILRVVVDYLEQRPEDRGSALWQIADSAFQHAWPCTD